MERGLAWINASKSSDAARGTRGGLRESGSQRAQATVEQRQGGKLLPKRKGGCAGREAPEQMEPWTWQRDGTSLRARARSKPSRGCESLRTERSEAGKPREKVAAHASGREEGRKPKQVRLRDHRALDGRRPDEWVRDPFDRRTGAEERERRNSEEETRHGRMSPQSSQKAGGRSIETSRELGFEMSYSRTAR